MLRIKLRHMEEVTGRELGDLLLSIDSIESVRDFDNPMHKGSEITMKPVINGFHGDGDRIYKFQSTHWVSQSVDEVCALIKSAEYEKNGSPEGLR